MILIKSLEQYNKTIHYFADEALKIITDKLYLGVDIPKVKYCEGFVRIGILLPYGAPECQLHWDKNMIFTLSFFHLEIDKCERIYTEFEKMLNEISRHYDCFELRKDGTEYTLIPRTKTAKRVLKIIKAIDVISVDSTFSDNSCLYIRKNKEVFHVTINYWDCTILIHPKNSS